MIPTYFDLPISHAKVNRIEVQPIDFDLEDV